MTGTGDAPAPAATQAWGRIPQGPPVAVTRGMFTLQRIERIAAVVTALGSAALGTQSLVIALADPAGLAPSWTVPVLGAVFGILAAMCVSCLVLPALSRYAAGAFASVYLLLLLAWPVLSEGSTGAPSPEPWTWYLVNVATMAAVIAFPYPLQLVWTIGTPLLYGLVRLVHGGFTGPLWIALTFEVTFSLILGGLLLTLATVFRRMAAGVDRERSATVAAYTQAAQSQAAQEERVAVSALMHDSVLAALIAAARADDPRTRSLAVSMAREALAGLADPGAPAGDLDRSDSGLDGLVRAIRAALTDLGVRLEIERVRPDIDVPVPGDVVAALGRAATQAVANAVQHAGGRGLRCRVAPWPEEERAPRGVEVVVRDSGPGFVLDEIPADRLGISASIMARVAAVEATADIDTGERGTTVTLRWGGGQG